MVKPISPNEVKATKESLIPEEVIRIFNDLIVEKWNGTEAHFKQSVVAERVVAALNIKEDEMYDKNMLDVEPIFRKAGWVVVYDKPAYCETYPATFTFSKKRKG